MQRRSSPWLLLASLVAACSADQMTVERRGANRPPETTLTSGPPDSTSGVNYKVHLWWSGTDADGTVDHFDYILVDHPARQDNIDGSGPHVVMIEVPSVDDPRWLGTTAHDSVFVTLADTLRHDPVPDDSTSLEDLRQLPHERWHTFFVRAVDDQGIPDATPDYVSFNSTNLAPGIWLQEPVQAGVTLEAANVARFRWKGSDPVGDGDVIDPVAARWVLLDAQMDIDGQPEGYPDWLHTLPDDHEWSPWFAWGSQTGREAVVRNLEDFEVLPEGDVRGFYVFAVQALDEAGARTMVFDSRTRWRNNVAIIKVSVSGPELLVHEASVGLIRFVQSQSVVVDVVADQELRFSWQADGARYGASSYEYRWAWNLRQPERDEHWDQDWCADCPETTHARFANGTHHFTLQARDDLGMVQEARYVLQVHEWEPTRDVLFVDDSQFTRVEDEARSDARWNDVLLQLAVESGLQFGTGDVFDVSDNYGTPPSFQQLFQHRAVVWSVREGERPSALRQLAEFVDPFLEANVNRRTHSALHGFLQSGGNLWISGHRPARALWPLQENSSQPVNVVHAGLDQHPGVDSAGTTSLLYEMGVDMFDCGAGPECARTEPEHTCQSLERIVHPWEESVGFPTASAHPPHTHWFEVQAADVGIDQAVSYISDLSLEHRHQLRLEAEDLRALREGHVIERITTENAFPQPHAHAVRLEDPLGKWGMPVLRVGPGWAPEGAAGRAEVEIYNMPGAMAVSQPRLIPRFDLVLPLYTYGSGVPEDVGIGRFYPLTADGQSVVLLAKGAPDEARYSRAIVGFEPEVLDEASHRALARFILVRHFRLGAGSQP